jgi:AcrR family transcriptional regulator
MNRKSAKGSGASPARKRKRRRAPRRPAAARKQQILESAGSVFAKFNYAKVGTADLARAAGVSEPALYRHFSGKREIYAETLRTMCERLLAIWGEIAAGVDDPLEAVRRIGIGYYDHIKGRAPVLRLFYEAIAEIDDEQIRRTVRGNFLAMVGFLEKLLRQARERGHVRPDIDMRVAAWHFMAIGFSFDLIHMLELGGELDRGKVDAWGRLYLDSLVADAKRKRTKTSGAPKNGRAICRSRPRKKSGC